MFLDTPLKRSPTTSSFWMRRDSSSSGSHHYGRIRLAREATVFFTALLVKPHPTTPALHKVVLYLHRNRRSHPTNAATCTGSTWALMPERSPLPTLDSLKWSALVDDLRTFQSLNISFSSFSLPL